MKNTLTRLATYCCVAIMLTACSKEQHNGPSPASPNITHSDPIEQLRTFRRQIEKVKADPLAKTDETMTLDEALWDIENNFNITYTDAEQYHSKVSDQTFELYVPVNENQEVLVNDAVNLYTAAVEQARQALLSEKSNVREYVSLCIDSIVVSQGMVKVSFKGKTGERTNYAPPEYHVAGSFGIEDNWMFASPLGKCDDPDIPSGADEQLQEKLFDALIGIIEEASPGCRNVYLNRTVIFFDGTDYAGVYYNTDPDTQCIPYHEMNRLFQGEKRLISQTIPERYGLQEYSPVSICIYGIQIEDYTAITHQNEIEYGLRCQVNTDEFGEVEDLIQQ